MDSVKHSKEYLAKIFATAVVASSAISSGSVVFAADGTNSSTDSNSSSTSTTSTPTDTTTGTSQTSGGPTQNKQIISGINLQAMPSTVSVGGQTTVIGQVYDVNNQPVPGVTLNLSSTAGTLGNETVTTDTYGAFGTSFTAPTTSGDASVTASVYGASTITGTADITVTDATSTGTSASGSSTTGSTPDGTDTGATASDGFNIQFYNPSTTYEPLVNRTIYGQAWFTTLPSTTDPVYLKLQVQKDGQPVGSDVANMTGSGFPGLSQPVPIQLDSTGTGYALKDTGMQISSSFSSFGLTSTFSEAGQYTVTATLIDIKTQDTVASQQTSVTVASPNVIGTIVSTSGAPIANAALDIAGQQQAYTVVADGNGQFSAYLPEGDWYVRNVRLNGVTIGQPNSSFHVSSDGSVSNPQISIAIPTLYGTLTTDGTTPAANMTLFVYSAKNGVPNWNSGEIKIPTNATGQFSMPLPAGEYYVAYYQDGQGTRTLIKRDVTVSDETPELNLAPSPINLDWYIPWSPTQVIAGNSRHAFVLTSPSTDISSPVYFEVQVTDSNGNPVTSGIHIQNAVNGQSTGDFVYSDSVNGFISGQDSPVQLTAGSQMEPAITFDNAGQYTLTYTVLTNSGAVVGSDSENFNVQAPSVTAQVYAADSQTPLRNTTLDLENPSGPFSVSVTTDSNGIFRDTIGSGTWKVVGVQGPTGEVDVPSTSGVEFTVPTDPTQTVSTSLTIPAADLKGTVTMDGKTPSAGGSVYITDSNGNGGSENLDQNGQFVAALADGTYLVKSLSNNGQSYDINQSVTVAGGQLLEQTFTAASLGIQLGWGGTSWAYKGNLSGSPLYFNFHFAPTENLTDPMYFQVSIQNADGTPVAAGAVPSLSFRPGNGQSDENVTLGDSGTVTLGEATGYQLVQGSDPVLTANFPTTGDYVVAVVAYDKTTGSAIGQAKSQVAIHDPNVQLSVKSASGSPLSGATVQLNTTDAVSLQNVSLQTDDSGMLRAYIPAANWSVTSVTMGGSAPVAPASPVSFQTTDDSLVQADVAIGLPDLKGIITTDGQTGAADASIQIYYATAEGNPDTTKGSFNVTADSTGAFSKSLPSGNYWVASERLSNGQQYAVNQLVTVSPNSHSVTITPQPFTMDFGNLGPGTQVAGATSSHYVDMSPTAPTGTNIYVKVSVTLSNGNFATGVHVQNSFNGNTATSLVPIDSSGSVILNKTSPITVGSGQLVLQTEFDNPGTYNVTYTIMDASSDTALGTLTKQITVQPASVIGTVYAADNTTPVPGVTLSLVGPNNMSNSVTTDGQGVFRAQLGSGQWTIVGVRDSLNDDLTFDATKQVSFTVPPNATGSVNTSISIRQVDLVGSVPVGSSYTGGWVIAQVPGSNNAAWLTLDTNGKFVGILPTGTYTLDSIRYSGAPDYPLNQSVSVTEGTVTTVDLHVDDMALSGPDSVMKPVVNQQTGINVNLAPTFSHTGPVYFEVEVLQNGTPVTNGVTIASSISGTYFNDTAVDGNGTVFFGKNGGVALSTNGIYVFPTFAQSGDYTVRVTMFDAQSNTAVDEATTSFTVMNPNVSGTVTNLNGGPMPNVQLDISQQNGPSRWVSTDNQGNFSTYLPDGTWTVTQVSDNQGHALDIQTANPFTVSSGVVPNQTVVLNVAPFTFQVPNYYFKPIPTTSSWASLPFTLGINNTDPIYFTVNVTENGNAPTDIRSLGLQANGQWYNVSLDGQGNGVVGESTGLAVPSGYSAFEAQVGKPGTYTVTATVYDQKTGESLGTSSGSITVVAPNLTGTVQLSDGTGVGGVQVFLSNSQATDSVPTDADGHFSAWLPNGTWTVSSVKTGSGQQDLAVAPIAQITTGSKAVTTSITVTQPAIEGTTTVDGSTPAPNASINLYPMENGQPDKTQGATYVQSGSTGKFVAFLPQGQYWIDSEYVQGTSWPVNQEVPVDANGNGAVVVKPVSTIKLNGPSSTNTGSVDGTNVQLIPGLGLNNPVYFKVSVSSSTGSVSGVTIKNTVDNHPEEVFSLDQSGVGTLDEQSPVQLNANSQLNFATDFEQPGTYTVTYSVYDSVTGQSIGDASETISVQQTNLTLHMTSQGGTPLSWPEIHMLGPSGQDNWFWGDENGIIRVHLDPGPWKVTEVGDGVNSIPLNASFNISDSTPVEETLPSDLENVTFEVNLNGKPTGGAYFTVAPATADGGSPDDANGQIPNWTDGTGATTKQALPKGKWFVESVTLYGQTFAIDQPFTVGDGPVPQVEINVTGTVVTDPDAVAAEKAALTDSVILNGNADLADITSDLSLPTTGVDGTTITWASSDTTAISTAGAVTPAATDKPVTLTATIQRGAASDTQTFAVTVKAQAQSTAPSAGNITVVNNPTGMPGKVQVAGLHAQDTVTVYDSASGMTTLGSAQVVTGQTFVDVPVTGLSPQGGTVYVTVTSQGELESPRTAVDYAAAQISYADAVASDLATLTNSVVLKNNPDVNDVTQNVYLPTVGANGTTISWVTSNANVISATGTVIRQDIDTAVTLTATVSKGTASQSEKFSLTVLAKPQAASPNASDIIVTNNPSDTQDTVVVRNLAQGDVVKVYASANSTNPVGQSAPVGPGQTMATVTIQELGATAGTVYVTITGTDTRESNRVAQTYGVEPPTDSASVSAEENALTTDSILNGNPDATDVTQSMNLPAFGVDGTSITWTSSDTTVITEDGTVNRQDTDSNVTLKATITKGNVAETLTFDVTVKAKPQAQPLDAKNITVINNPSDTPDTVEVAGVTAGDIIRVYDAATGGHKLAEVTVGTSSTVLQKVAFSIPELGADAGTVYVTVTHLGTRESVTTAQTYGVEPPTNADSVTAEKADLTAAQLLNGNSGLDNVMGDLALPTFGTDGTIITWTSSDPTVIAADGSVTRPAYQTQDATVTLTATIQKGNVTDTKTFTATVKQYTTPVGNLQVKVVDQTSSAPLAGAAVLVQYSDGTSSKAFTNAQGVASIQAKEGSYKVFAYENGYLPEATTATVQSGQSATATVSLPKSPLVVSNTTVIPMTIDQIKAAGIDTSNPDNQWVYKFQIDLAIDEQPVTFMVNGAGDILGGSLAPVTGGGVVAYPVVMPWPGHPDVAPTVGYLVIPGQTSWLKQFFTVGLQLANAADPSFSIDNATATLNLPQGLSLAPTATPQSLTVNLGSLAGGDKQNINWYVRGDAPGTYAISADFTGTLNPFEEAINSHLTSSAPFKVWGSDALKMHVDAQDNAIGGQPYTVKFGIENVSDVLVYNLTLQLLQDGKLNYTYADGQQLTQQVTELDPGKTQWFTYTLIPTISGTLDLSKSFSLSVGGNATVPTDIESIDQLAKTSTLTTGSTTVYANGQATVTGTVYDAGNNPLPGVTLTLSSDSGVVNPGAVMTDANGSYQFNVTAPGASGPMTVTASVYGQPQEVLGTTTITVADNPQGNTPPSPTVHAVKDTDRAVTGISVPGSTVTVTINGVVDGSVKVNADGTFSVPIAAQKAGAVVSVTTKDTAGNVSAATEAKVWGDECFIATAAFGSKFEPNVVLLRQFRDNYLLTNKPGQAFVKFYYRTSPPIARFISGNEPLKAIVRGMLTPVVSGVKSILAKKN